MLPWILGFAVLIVAGAAAPQTLDVSSLSGDEIKALQQRLAANGCYRGVVDAQVSLALIDAIKACPPQDPILRVETGMHVAQIWQIGVDRTCRVAATGSWDKTVRIWSLPDGNLLRTLRVPIAIDNGGKIYATAISPDGRWVAAGGWDAKSRSQASVYVFNTATGELVANVGPFPGIIYRLAFSPDGHLLAVTGVGSVGLNVVDTSDWHVIQEDHDFSDFAISAFAPDGRLYAAGNGKIRQYGSAPPFHKEREATTRDGRRPISIAIDPLGQIAAVGFLDSTAVDAYDAQTLKFRFAAQTKQIDNGNLGEVAWSADGAHLVAGGEYTAPFQGGYLAALVTFGRDGKRIGPALPLSSNSIHGVLPCGDDLAVAANDPAFGLVDPTGGKRLWKTSVAPDVRGDRNDSLTIAPDAKAVRFGLEYGGQGRAGQPVLFDATQATVRDAPDAIAGFIAPVTEGLPIGHWQDDTEPTFAGSPIQLEPHDISHALAIRRDRTGFVLGAEGSLRTFDANGRQLWARATPGVAWGVNLSADGRVVIAAYDDGTIRWHRWSDGLELLALFVDKADKRWVAWTPAGYYMASPGGEDLIGWQLNRGWNQAADFFPASRFRDRFNRPDILRLVLTTLDEDEAIKQANEAARRKADTRPLIERLPPIVRITAPAADAHMQNGTVTLGYALRSPSGQPVNRLDLLINGRPVKSFGLPLQAMSPDVESTGSLQVVLTQHVSEVGLIAWSEGLASQAEQVKVTWDGAPEVSRKLYALVVGVSNYADPAMALKYAAKDAGDFDKALQAQKDLYYSDVQTRVLKDRDVTRASVIKGLQWLEQMATDPNDVSVLFMAGHGMTDDKQTYWFYTSDADDDNVRINGVSQEEIRKSLQGLQGKVLWFLDTCHAGTAAKRWPVDMNVLVNTVSASENGGIVVFASSTGRQVSVESADLGNGAFTKAVVEGIALGKAAPLSNFITTSSLDTYVAYRVSQITNNQQTPVMERPPEEPDFAFAEVRK
jgi:hypothetical protein